VRFHRDLSPSRGRPIGAPVACEAREGADMKTIWLCGVCVALALPVSGGERMTMSVTPAQGFAPSPLRVRVRIEPSVENHSLTITADSGGFFRSSEIPLEGDRAPRTFELEFRSVPEGDYDIISVVRDSTGRPRSIARTSARRLSASGGH
jgi:hypothetical protein